MMLTTSNIDKILELYTPPYRFLRHIAVDYPLARGVFVIGDCPYAIGGLEHLTAIEAQFCINQLTYVAFAEWILEGRFPELHMSFDEFLSNMGEHMLIARTRTELEFRRKIETNSPVNMTGRLKSSRLHENNWFAVMEYDFENGRARGSMTLVLEK